MERWAGRVALVTGASAGIGAAITRSLVKSGMKVVGCARNVERIQKIADELKDEPGSLKPVKCDVRQEEDILAMFQSIKSDPDLGGVDVCVNNAGLGHDTSLMEGNSSQWREMLDVNVLALCICSREAYKSQRERGVNDGHFILINSMSGHRIQLSKSNHFYAATKHAVTAIQHGMRFEFREDKVAAKVTSISPGDVETEFLNRMLKDDAKAKEIYGSSTCLQPSDIVDAVIYALSSSPRAQIDDIWLRPIDQLD
ncbi:dehydrogenase/reductase SDR family member 11-like [Haliotis rufescens]|uniref:dehydrogenase/reductase SDR family member 11-like n=1 Tax=Haliotis rufescens TaxID=6454 RepID=UPI00201E79C4|nr:dehydrogenase/reductase SDR family member 11-like [Haliotis rufescens]